MTLRQFRSLLAVGETGGFTAAAHHLGRTQPAISRAIGQVESALGAQMFHRIRGRCRPTPAGEALLRRGHRLFALLSSISNRLADTLTDRELVGALAVAQSGSLSGGARRLGLSQPAISQAVADLERLLERPLFLRGASAVSPAPGSLAILRTFGLALAEIEQGVEEVRFMCGGSNGRLRIGALPIARPLLLPRTIDAVLDRYPEARISVIEGNYQALDAGLRSGEIEAIVGSFRGINGNADSDLVTRHLFDDGLAIVGAPGHPALSGGLFSLTELAGQNWIVPLPGVPLRDEFDDLMSFAGVERPAKLIETNSITVVRGLLATGHRLAVVSEHQVYADMRTGTLVRFPIEQPVKRRPVGLVMRREMRHTPLFSAFIDAIGAIAASF